MNRSRRRKQKGFTLVEVMIAIGVMTVGSLGILSMHQAVSNANRSANEMNTALAITERWVERIERDSLLWTEPGFKSLSLQGTHYLTALFDQATGVGWFRPTPADAEESFAFNYVGRDVASDSEDLTYCVNLRMSWVRQGSSARVDIRTYWFRGGHVPGGATHPLWVKGKQFSDSQCQAGVADGWQLGQAPNVNVVFASTVVTWLRREGT